VTIMTKGRRGQLRPIDLNALVPYTHDKKVSECHNEQEHESCCSQRWMVWAMSEIGNIPSE